MRQTKLLLLGTHGQHNIGDELLLESFLNQLKSEFDITVNSYTPAQTAKEFDVKTFNTDGGYLGILKAILASDAILFAGGNILKELHVEYGGQRYGTLYKVLMMVFAARLFGKKVCMSCIGIGPLKSKKGLFMTKMIAKLTNHISVRDQESLAYLAQIGLPDKGIFVPDIAFSFDIKSGSTTRNTAEIKTIALNLCRNIENPKNWDYFVTNLAHDLSNFYSQTKFKIIGVPMQMSPAKPADYKTLEDFKTLLHSLNPEISFEILTPKTPQDVIKIINQVDLVVSERLHLLILSSILKIPFVALEYDVKIAGFLKSYGFSQYGVKISKQFGSKDIFNKIKLAFDNYNQFVADLTKVTNIYKIKTNEYVAVLKILLKS